MNPICGIISPSTSSRLRRLAELVATVKDLGYLAHKTLMRTAYATEADLTLAEQRVPSDVPLRLLTHNFANMGHLLNLCSTLSRPCSCPLQSTRAFARLSDLCQAFEQDIPRPYLQAAPAARPARPSLIRTLSGHRLAKVYGCAISPAGDYRLASYDQTLKVWDARTGEERRTLRGHTDWVTWVCDQPGGRLYRLGLGDQTLKVWDARTGEKWRTLRGHTDEVNGCAISPGGDYHRFGLL